MLEAHDLRAVRGGRVLFDHLNLQLAAGALLLLRGPNGAGKTTLLRLLAGLATPAAGRVVRPDGVLWIGHRPGVTPALSVRENLHFTCALEGADPAGVAAALTELGLARDRDTPAARLSEGQCRRVALARLALSGAPLWLLDEPLTALDESSVAWVEQRIAAHRAHGGAVALATHRALHEADAPQVLELG